MKASLKVVGQLISVDRCPTSPLPPHPRPITERRLVFTEWTDAKMDRRLSRRSACLFTMMCRASRSMLATAVTWSRTVR